MQNTDIEAFIAASDTFFAYMKTLEPAVIDYRPDLPDAWTIREHAVHLLDADIFAYARMRSSIAEPGAEVQVWEEEQWPRALQYAKSDLEQTLAAFRTIRLLALETLTNLSPELYSSAWCKHKVRGKVTLEDLVRIYTKHVASHLEYIERNVKLYAQASPK